VDGFAYIPVYAHEMRLDVNMQFYKSGSVNTDSYVRVSLNYLIFENYAAEPQNEAVLQALVNFCNEARKLKY
jgi:hypothetical protein